MFKKNIIEFKNNKIQVLYITNKKPIITFISKFNLNTKEISIKIQEKENKWIEKNISKEKIAFSKMNNNNIDDYKKLKETLNIKNINDYLLENINDDLLKEKCEDPNKKSK